MSKKSLVSHTEDCVTLLGKSHAALVKRKVALISYRTKRFRNLINNRFCNTAYL